MSRMHDRGMCVSACAGWRWLLLLASAMVSASPAEDWQWRAIAPAAGETRVVRHVDMLTQAVVAPGTRITFVPAYDAGNGPHLRRSPTHEQNTPLLHLRPAAASFAANGVAGMDTWSLDYIRAYGRWAWRGEFSGGVIDDGSEGARFLGGYGALRWFASGHSRRDTAANGRFIRVDPPLPAWELVVRYQRTHGRQRDSLGQDRMNTSTGAWTLGGYWHLRPNLRLLLNLVTTLDLDHLTHAADRSYEWNGQVHYDF